MIDKFEPDLENEKLMIEYADLVVESLKENCLNEDEDPFVTYASNLRLHFYLDKAKYRSSIFKGYKALLEHLRSRDDPKS